MSLLQDLIDNGSIQEIKDEKGNVIGYSPININLGGGSGNTSELEAQVKKLQEANTTLETSNKELEAQVKTLQTENKELSEDLKQCEEGTENPKKSQKVK